MTSVHAEVWAFEEARHHTGYRVSVHGLTLAPGTVAPLRFVNDRAIWLLSDHTTCETTKHHPLVHHPCAWQDTDDDLTFSLTHPHHEQLYRDGRIRQSAEILVLYMQLT